MKRVPLTETEREAIRAFGKALLEYRKKHGLSQARLSRVSHVSTKTIVPLKRGKWALSHMPSVSVVVRLWGGLKEELVVLTEWCRILGIEPPSPERIDKILYRRVGEDVTGGTETTNTSEHMLREELSRLHQHIDRLLAIVEQQAQLIRTLASPKK